MNCFRVIGGVCHLPVFESTLSVNSPSAGMLIFSESDNKPQFYNGDEWVDLCRINSVSGISPDSDERFVVFG